MREPVLALVGWECLTLSAVAYRAQGFDIAAKFLTR
jgi:hypothetical protein